ncbi:hypothetical protein [Botrimarina hoheduenensis]|uniref:Uncharacterized protein n=1 Tax=Botrimarina hoheduenensis TaxID=2528000 RepID=A0A5C5VXH6_9BACT|nr:hypothetical protein [Botrimarina hoheduenensis]TWT42837.1 hypothetical protein Pla111_24750 [Botrimarina hoheduenensis]
MSIQLTCPNCEAILRLADAMAGRMGACRECGGEISVPQDLESFRPLQERPLGKATLDDIVKELARRGETAVLTVLGDRKKTRDQRTDSTILSQSESDTQIGLGPGVRQYTTEEIPPTRLEQLFTGLARLAQMRIEAERLAQSKDAIDPAEGAGSFDSKSNFEFKGDPLGMSLADFRLRHERQVEGRRRRMPWCSDESPGVNNPELHSEAWHAAAGIVHARIELPFENNSPTVGGVRTSLVLYQFVDERLFQVTAFLPPEGLNQVVQALNIKYGEPQSVNHEPRQMLWWKLNSSIEVSAGRLHPREDAIVRYFHDELLAEASRRRPSGSADL